MCPITYDRSSARCARRSKDRTPAQSAVFPSSERPGRAPRLRVAATRVQQSQKLRVAWLHSVVPVAWEFATRQPTRINAPGIEFANCESFRTYLCGRGDRYGRHGDERAFSIGVQIQGYISIRVRAALSLLSSPAASGVPLSFYFSAPSSSPVSLSPNSLRDSLSGSLRLSAASTALFL